MHFTWTLKTEGTKPKEPAAVAWTLMPSLMTQDQVYSEWENIPTCDFWQVPWPNGMEQRIRQEMNIYFDKPEEKIPDITGNRLFIFSEAAKHIIEQEAPGDCNIVPVRTWIRTNKKKSTFPATRPWYLIIPRHTVAASVDELSDWKTRVTKDGITITNIGMSLDIQRTVDQVRISKHNIWIEKNHTIGIMSMTDKIRLAFVKNKIKGGRLCAWDLVSETEIPSLVNNQSV